MRTTYQKPDGSAPLIGAVVTADHHVDRFIITVRSLNGLSSGAIKTLLQEKYEVTNILHPDKTITVKE